MHAVEDRMWWYRGLRALAGGLLVRAFAHSVGGSPGDGSVLDAGCGTGGMLKALGPPGAGWATPGLGYDTNPARPAAAQAGRPGPAGFGDPKPGGAAALARHGSLGVVGRR